MDITDYGDGKLIVLSKAFDTRPKILNLIYFFVFTATAIAVTLLVRNALYLTLASLLFFAAGIIIYLIAAYRFLNKSLQSEKLFINKTNLTIIRDGFLSKQEAVYSNELISAFRHLDKPEPPQHPLGGQSFDYLGFQTQQQVINNMYGDNRLAFDYDGRMITFGENIYTWEFDEVVMVLRDITGRRLTKPDELINDAVEDDEAYKL